MSDDSSIPLPLFDSHCHLDFHHFDSDREEILDNCMKLGVSHICIPGTQASLWESLLKLTIEKTSPVNLYPALGLHPYFLQSHTPEDLNTLNQYLTRHSEPIVAIGEIGLDFSLEQTDKTLQVHFFVEQLKLAEQYKLPVIIHARKSYDEVLKQLRKIKLPRAGIIHAFSGSKQQARQFIELGFKLGFGGGITYPRARKTRQLASTLPLTSIVLETDAPDMPLNGYQGERNSPSRLPEVLNSLASLRSESREVLGRTTFTNAMEVLRNGY